MYRYMLFDAVCIFVLDGSTWLIAVGLLVYTCDQDGEQVPHLSSWQEPTRQAGTRVELTMFLEVEYHATD